MLKKILALTLMILASTAAAQADVLSVADSATSTSSTMSAMSIKPSPVPGVTAPADDEKNAMGDDDEDNDGPLGDKDGDDAED